MLLTIGVWYQNFCQSNTQHTFQPLCLFLLTIRIYFHNSNWIIEVDLSYQQFNILVWYDTFYWKSQAVKANDT